VAYVNADGFADHPRVNVIGELFPPATAGRSILSAASCATKNYSTAAGHFRSPFPYRGADQEVRGEIRAILDNIAARDADFRYEMKDPRTVHPVLTDAKSRLVAMSGAVRDVRVRTRLSSPAPAPTIRST
jgi:hypothetical protein